YVSKHNKRKDYEENMVKYERDLKVPYYLTFYPDTQEPTLYPHNRRKYVTVKPNRHGGCSIPQLEMEVGLLGGWVRFWFRGELLPLPADLLRERDEERRSRIAAEEEVARLRAELDALRRHPPE